MSSCTAGFNVIVNGVRGMTTAGHCSSSQSYRAFGSTTWVGTTYRSQAWNRLADVQWHSLVATPGTLFHGQSTTTTTTLVGRQLRTVQGGNWACHRGKTTGYSCGTVVQINYQPTYSGACNGQTCAATFMVVQSSSLKCYLGDSGGPVFSGGYAYGWYKGQSSSGTTAADCNSMHYMAVDYLSQISGATLLTSP